MNKANPRQTTNGLNYTEAPEVDKLGYLRHKTSPRSTFTLAISLELSPFAV